MIGRWWLGLVWCAGLSLAAAQQPELQHLRFQESDALLSNPGQGWMVYAGQASRFPNTVAYLRFDWARVEPEDGTFDWTYVDQAIDRARKHGQTLGMRVQTANAHSEGYYSSPRWLFEEGCRGFEYTNDGSDAAAGGKPQPRIEPDYADPIYLAKHAAFMRAFGERYNGRPEVEFLDIGSYGIWGEWHTTHPAPVAVRRQIVDMYVSAFSKTPLVFMSDDVDTMSYALAHGAGLRRDGVGSPWHEARWAGTPAYAKVPAMGEAWKRAPIVFEWYQGYAYMHAKGWSMESAVAWMLRNHVTLINDNLHEVPAEVMPLIERLARLAGFRFVLREITLPQVARPGESVGIGMQWANVGVGKLYRPAQIELRLRDADGKVVATAVAEGDPKEWLPGDWKAAAAMKLPEDVAEGEYALEVSIADRAGERPALHLAIVAAETDGWYRVGMLHVAVMGSAPGPLPFPSPSPRP